MPEEAANTKKARTKLKEIFQRLNYNIEEELRFPQVTNYIGESMEEQPYQTDFIMTKTFILELDPTTNKKGKAKGHGTKIKRTHDKWRDINFRQQVDLKTVRLDPVDVNKLTEQDILSEIEYQLRSRTKERNDNNIN